IRVRLKQSGAARSQSAVEDDFDRSHSESSVKFVQRRAFHQESLRIRSRTVDGFVDAKLELSFTVEFSHQSDVFVASPGILNLAPPQIDAPLRADNQSLFEIGLSRRRNMFDDEILRLIEQHSRRLAGSFIFENLAAERIRRVLIDSGNLQRCAVCDRSVT